jgi:hypothetical protein
MHIGVTKPPKRGVRFGISVKGVKQAFLFC